MHKRVFELAEDERIITARHADAFRHYLSNRRFRAKVDGSMLASHRTSLATLESYPPAEMGLLSRTQKLHDFRGRFRAALDELAREVEAEASRAADDAWPIPQPKPSVRL